MHSTRRRGWTALVAAAVIAAVAMTFGTALAAPGPAQIGSWTAPFEEGGSTVPRCKPDPNGPAGQVVCKPTAVGAAALPDGTVWYSNGLEATENIRYTADFEAAPRARNSLSRILNLTGGTPVFGQADAANPAGVGTNPNIKPGNPGGTSHIFGLLGVPGRPGDGATGSAWGMLGLPPTNPSNPPDDIQKNDGDLFCSDQAQLADGSLLIAGGTDWYNEPAVMDRDKGAPADVGIAELEGLRLARIYHPDTHKYVQVGNMKYGRWYPALVTMPDGTVKVFGGVTKLIKDTQGSQVRRTETFHPNTGQWTEDYVGSASETSLPLFARLFLMPNGKILYSGVGQTWAPEGMAVDEALWAFQQFYNPRTMKWQRIGLAPLGAIGGAPEVMLAMDAPFTSATVMTVGGTLLPSPGTYFATPFTTLTTVTSDGKVTAKRGADLVNRRWYSSAVTLPTGEVLAFSGAEQDEVLMTGFELPVHQAELYDPVTKKWMAMASATRDRTYHNSAILLGDGRVLVGGHAPIPTGVGLVDAYGAHHDLIPGVTANNDRDPSFEVFSPPYLFRGARPVISYAPSAVEWGSSFGVTTDATSVDSVVLSRLPSAQHITDSDARTLRLAFTGSNGSLTVSAPPSGVIAPPGYYYLFVMKKTPSGPIPSVARIVHVGSFSSGTNAPQPFASQAGPPIGGSATAPTDSSYINQPPPLPLGAVSVGMIAAGVGIPARRRRLFPEDEG